MFGLSPAVAYAARIRGRVSRYAAVPAPAQETPRPVVVPETLEDLCGPGSGVVELPVRLYWSAGSRRFDLSSPHDAADMYEAVLDAACKRADLTGYLNASLLLQVWPALGMSRLKRTAWESRFPVLRRQRLAAAA